MDNPLVSIIIPTFNQSKLIGETLDSIISQEYTHWECLVIDDDSSDATEEVLLRYCKKDKRISYYKRPQETPKGANSCRNYGLDKSSGDFIQFFDSDDLMTSQCISGRIAKFSDNEDKDLLTFSMGLLKDGQKIDIPLPSLNIASWDVALEHFLGPNRLPWNTLTVMYRSKFIKNRISYNEALMRFQDIEFNIRLLASLKPNFKCYDVIDCYYRQPTVKNVKPNQFYLDVFSSVPEYFRSLSNSVPEATMNELKTHFQEWFFNLTGLYTRRHIPYTLYAKALKSVKDYTGLGFFKSLNLKCLFILKKYFRKMRGHTFIANLLKSNY